MLLAWRRLLVHDLFGDLLAPCILKHYVICTREFVYSDRAKAIASPVRHANVALSRAKLCESVTVLMLIFLLRHVAINSARSHT